MPTQALHEGDSSAAAARSAFGEALRINWGKTVAGKKDITTLYNDLRKKAADAAKFDDRFRSIFESVAGLPKLPVSGSGAGNNGGTKGTTLSKGSQLMWYVKRVGPAALVVGGAVWYLFWQHKNQAKPKAKAAAPVR